MPSHSRTRDRSSYRDRGRENNNNNNNDNYYHSRHRRHNKDDQRLYDGDDVGIERRDGGDDDDDRNDNDYRRQRQREQQRSARRGGQSSSRGYQQQGYYEVEVEEDDDSNNDAVDYSRARRGKSRRREEALRNIDEPPRTPTRPSRQARAEDERAREEDYARGTRTRTRERTTPKAKESPATSPKKRLDREGYRRNTSRAPRDASPPLRERRHRHRYESGDDVRRDDADRDQDRELRRQQRRRERLDREYAAQKHASTDSGNSASQLLSADALAKLNNHYERSRNTQREEAQAEEDEEREREQQREQREREREREREQNRRERRRRRTRDIGAVEDDAFQENNNDDDNVHVVRDTIRVEKRRERRRQPPPTQKSERRGEYRRERRVYDDDDDDYEDNDADHLSPRQDQKRRLVSGAIMEEGRSHKLFFWRRLGRRNEPVEAVDAFDVADDGDDGDDNGGRGDSSMYSRDLKDPHNDDYIRMPFWRRKRNWIIAGVATLILAIVISVAVVESNKKSSGSSSSSSGSSGSSSSYGTYNSSLSTISESSIPASAKGTYLDPFTWYDTRDFNLTYTNETVGGLPIMGLNSTWDDFTQPNSNVPPLNETFPYGSTPIRGVNVGGWLSIEPFITPSLFSGFSSVDGVIDEWTLTSKLGSLATNTIENHYTTFIQEEDFAEIAAAGLDHVRIPYSYWAVTTYDDDPYVKQISWRYLLRAIEYCRKYGLRVNLDLHGLPGSQNGYNHSGRQGLIRWLNGTNGTLNGQRSLDVHNQLSQFFAQPRYENVVAIYGLANEPLMLDLNVSTVLNWTVNATEIVQANGVKAKVSMGDGFLNLDKWEYMMKDNVPSNMILDTHQYTIFNINEIDLNHTAKISLICDSWLSMIEQVNSTTEGWGPTICGEFSMSDTDCPTYLNNVNTGTRWEGTLDGTSTPDCYLKNSECSCTDANAAVSDYSDDYKLWLQTYAEAQFAAFETAMGWFYWTWETESAPQWSYKQARAGGFLPQLAYQPNFTCSDSIPSFGDLPEYY